MIDGRFKDEIFVQIGTPAFGGGTTWADRPGHNMGYIRALGARERASTDKPTLFATHRAVMTCDVVPIYGERLRLGTSYYTVKLVDAHGLSGGGFQTVDCEVVV